VRKGPEKRDPEGAKPHYNPVGGSHRRSPPVCFSELECCSFPILRMFPEREQERRLSTLRRTVRTLVYTLGIASSRSTMCRMYTPMRNSAGHKPGVRIRYHSAQHSLTNGVLPGFLLRLSDHSIVLPVHPECSAHRSPTNHHTFRIWREDGGSHPWVSPFLSLVTLHAVMRVDAPLTSTDGPAG